MELEVANQTIQSIGSYGLRPYTDLPSETKKKVNPIFILGTSVRTPEVCVNYVNLEERNETEIDNALHVAAFEGSRGIFGVAHERVWPFHTKDRSKYLATEFPERLSSTILLVLKPPTHLLLPKTQEQIAANAQLQRQCITPGTHLGYYTIDDGLYQCSESDCLDEAFLPKDAHRKTNCIVEIKTGANITPDEIWAVLTPKIYLSKVEESFPGLPKDRILEVSSKLMAFNKFAAFLPSLHDEALFKGRVEMELGTRESIETFGRFGGPVERVLAPDYEEALKRLRQTWKPNKSREPVSLNSFSLHVVRLPTRYDFDVRWIQDLRLVESHELIKETKAHLLQQVESGGGWVAVNKLFATDYPKLALRPQIASFASIFQDNFSDYTRFFERLKKAKGPFTMVNVRSLSIDQQRQLIESGAYFISMLDFGDDGYRIAFPTEDRDKIRAILTPVAL